MQKEYRLKKNGTFQYVYRRGSSTSCKEIVLLYTKARTLNIGFSVSKKLGNAVNRNFTKRRLREIFRKILPLLKNGNYVVVAKPPINNLKFSEIEDKIIYLLQKQNLLK